MTGSGSEKLSVESYYATFGSSDVYAVTDVASYIAQTNQSIAAVVFQIVERNAEQVGIVHVMEHTPQGEVFTQVNWSSPGTPPGAYDRYAWDFYDFSGPLEIQENRAALLAEVLQVLVLTGYENMGGLRIPDLGVMMRENPLKDNPFAHATLNFGTHIRNPNQGINAIGF